MYPDLRDHYGMGYHPYMMGYGYPYYGVGYHHYPHHHMHHMHHPHGYYNIHPQDIQIQSMSLNMMPMSIPGMMTNMHP
jgi:hypothetical protein